MLCVVLIAPFINVPLSSNTTSNSPPRTPKSPLTPGACFPETRLLSPGLHFWKGPTSGLCWQTRLIPQTLTNTQALAYMNTIYAHALTYHHGSSSDTHTHISASIKTYKLRASCFSHLSFILPMFLQDPDQSDCKVHHFPLITSTTPNTSHPQILLYTDSPGYGKTTSCWCS